MKSKQTLINFSGSSFKPNHYFGEKLKEIIGFNKTCFTNFVSNSFILHIHQIRVKQIDKNLFIFTYIDDESMIGNGNGYMYLKFCYNSEQNLIYDIYVSKDFHYSAFSTAINMDIYSDKYLKAQSEQDRTKALTALFIVFKYFPSSGSGLFTGQACWYEDYRGFDDEINYGLDTYSPEYAINLYRSLLLKTTIEKEKIHSKIMEKYLSLKTEDFFSTIPAIRRGIHQSICLFNFSEGCITNETRDKGERKFFVNKQKMHFFNGKYAPYSKLPEIILSGLYEAFFNSFTYKGVTFVGIVENEVKKAHRFYQVFNRTSGNLKIAIFYLELFKLFE